MDLTSANSVGARKGKDFLGRGIKVWWMDQEGQGFIHQDAQGAQDAQDAQKRESFILSILVFGGYLAQWRRDAGGNWVLDGDMMG
jgi:hypothetical protein